MSKNIKSKPRYGLNTVGGGKRFLNYLLDLVFIVILFFLLSYVVGFFIGLYVGQKGGDISLINFEGIENRVRIILFVLYYIVCEYFFNKTPGKWITKTRVVNLSGNSPYFGEVLARSLSRFIPFEPFSFLGKYNIGWHDTISGTRVVHDKAIYLTDTQGDIQELAENDNISTSKGKKRLYWFMALSLLILGLVWFIFSIIFWLINLTMVAEASGDFSTIEAISGVINWILGFLVFPCIIITIIGIYKLIK